MKCDNKIERRLRCLLKWIGWLQRERRVKKNRWNECFACTLKCKHSSISNGFSLWNQFMFHSCSRLMMVYKQLEGERKKNENCGFVELIHNQIILIEMISGLTSCEMCVFSLLFSLNGTLQLFCLHNKCALWTRQQDSNWNQLKLL